MALVANFFSFTNFTEVYVAFNALIFFSIWLILKQGVGVYWTSNRMAFKALLVSIAKLAARNSASNTS